MASRPASPPPAAGVSATTGRGLASPISAHGVSSIRAEGRLFDVDFTLFRPGPELGPEGYRRVGERHGLALEPGSYEEARAAAIESLQRNHELVHDEEIWIAFTEQIVLGMGGDAERRTGVRDGHGA